MKLTGWRGGSLEDQPDRRCAYVNPDTGKQCKRWASRDATMCHDHLELIHRQAAEEAEAAAEAMVERMADAGREDFRDSLEARPMPELTEAMLDRGQVWILDVLPSASDGEGFSTGMPPEWDEKNWFLMEDGVHWAKWRLGTREEELARLEAARQAGIGEFKPEPRKPPEIEYVDPLGKRHRRAPVGKTNPRKRSLAQLLFGTSNRGDFDPLDPRHAILKRAQEDPAFLMEELSRRGKRLNPAEVAHILIRMPAFFHGAIARQVAEEQAAREREIAVGEMYEESRQANIEYEMDKGFAPDPLSYDDIDRGGGTRSDWAQYNRDRDGIAREETTARSDAARRREARDKQNQLAEEAVRAREERIEQLTELTLKRLGY